MVNQNMKKKRLFITAIKHIVSEVTLCTLYGFQYEDYKAFGDIYKEDHSTTRVWKGSRSMEDSVCYINFLQNTEQ